jgi:ABC-type transporter Mla subunit MlaD
MRGIRSAFAGKPEDQLVSKLNRSLDEVTKALTDSVNARNPSMELVRLLPPALNNLNTALQDFANATASSPPAAEGNAENPSP